MVKVLKVMVTTVLVSLVLVIAAGPAAAASEPNLVACWNNAGCGDGR